MNSVCWGVKPHIGKIMRPKCSKRSKIATPTTTIGCGSTARNLRACAEIRISYIPDVKMVESKSLKLYLFSFRNHGDFHEDCVNTIMKDLIRLMEPKYIEVTGLFTPRGGISIYPFANYGRPGTKYARLAEQRFAAHE